MQLTKNKSKMILLLNHKIIYDISETGKTTGFEKFHIQNKSTVLGGSVVPHFGRTSE